MNVNGIESNNLQPSILDRLVKKSEDPVISTIAFIIFGLVVIAIFSPITAAVLASGVAAFIIGAIALGTIFGFDDDEGNEQIQTSRTNRQSSTDDDFETYSPDDDIDDKIPPPKPTKAPSTKPVSNDDDGDDDDIPIRVQRNNDKAVSSKSTEAPSATAIAKLIPKYSGKCYPVRKGIPNTGNTCWLNSVLQFIASSDYFDSMLDTELKLTSKDSLRSALQAVIKELRSDGTAPLDLKVYKDLQREIALHMPAHKCNGTQRDAVDFIRDLIQKLEWKPSNSNQFQAVMVYDSTSSGGSKQTRLLDESWYFPISFKPNDQRRKQASLDELATQADVVQVKADDTNENLDFVKSPHFSHLPNDLMLHIDRAALNNNLQQIKIQTLLKTQKNGMISLIEERVVGNKTEPYKIVYYKIQASIVHSGTQDGGHYVCHSRVKSNSDQADELLLHDDSNEASNLPDANFGANGYFIHLKRYYEQAL